MLYLIMSFIIITVKKCMKFCLKINFDIDLTNNKVKYFFIKKIKKLDNFNLKD